MPGSLLNQIGQKLSAKNIRGFGNKAIGGLKDFGKKAMSTLGAVRQVVNTVKTPLEQAAMLVAPEIGISAEALDKGISKGYDLYNKFEKGYSTASKLNKIAQNIQEMKPPGQPKPGGQPRPGISRLP